MRKIQSIIAIVCTLIFLSGLSNFHAVAKSNLSKEENLFSSRKDLSHINADYLNYSLFEVNIAETGNYYAEFWLMPAKYNDGTYTTFSVFVNDNFVFI